MKKTLLTAVLCCSFAATASAASNLDSDKLVVFENLSGISSATTVGGLTYTPSTKQVTGAEGALYHAVSGKQGESSVVFTLDVDAITNSTLTSLTPLISFNFNSHTLGIAIKTDGSLTRYYDTSTTHGTGSFTLNDLKALNTTAAAAGEPVVLTAIASSAYGSAGSPSTILFKADGSAALDSSGTGWAANTTLNGITINTDYIKNIAIAPCALNPEGVAAASSALITAVVPEPTTATLSLLALAGLAARRRRK